jgi:hypothetical protein
MTVLALLLHDLRLAAPYALPGAAVVAIARALWEGARGEVVRFGADVAVLGFAWLRRLLRMRP